MHFSLLETIALTIKTRHPPKNKSKICAYGKNGGVTKSFSNIAELAKYIFFEHGNSWQQFVRLKETPAPAPPPRQPAPTRADAIGNARRIYQGNCLFTCLVWDVSKMRRHLQDCLENRKLTNFPIVSERKVCLGSPYCQIQDLIARCE